MACESSKVEFSSLAEFAAYRAARDAGVIGRYNSRDD
jgi:hypothetical protein